MQYISRLFCVILSIFLLAGCETNIAATSDAVQLVPSARHGTRLIATQGGHPHLRAGYDLEKIRAGSIWDDIGTIPQGHVLKPENTSVMVKTGSDNQQAYLVMIQNRVIGAYLPAQSVFVPVRKDSSITFAEALR